MEAQAAWRDDGAMPTRHEEQTMNLSRKLLWWRAVPARALRRPATPDWVDAGSEPSPEQLDDVLLGCGWFDSSHALTTGLQVTEHLTPERVANEVPLGWWLDWQSGAAVPSGQGGLCRR
jgi:hypothetical protein